MAQAVFQHRTSEQSAIRNPKQRTADDGIRTRDLRFTKPLLYQLSYVGTSGKDAIRRLGEQARTCSRFAVRNPNQSIAKPALPHPSAPGRIRCGEQGDGYNGNTNISPISRSAMRSGVLTSAASKRSIGSRNGSKLSRNV